MRFVLGDGPDAQKPALMKPRPFVLVGDSITDEGQPDGIAAMDPRRGSDVLLVETGTGWEA